MNQVLARHYYSRSTDPPDRAGELELIRRIEAGDEEALRDLVDRNFRYVVKMAHRYKNMGLPIEDLISEGCIGLIIAARRFDSSRQVRFITYAAWWIRNSMQDALTGQSRVVRLPERERLRLAQLRREHGNSPLTARVKENKYQETRTPEYSTQSLEDGTDPYGGLVNVLVEEDAADPEKGTIRRDFWEKTRRAFRSLDARSRRILLLRYGLDRNSAHTLEQIGRILRLSRERVRQIEVKALEELRLSTEQPPRTDDSGRRYPARS